MTEIEVYTNVQYRYVPSKNYRKKIFNSSIIEFIFQTYQNKACFEKVMKKKFLYFWIKTKL
jgi:hypothetical protein